MTHTALFQRVAHSLARQGLMQHLQVSLLRVEPGCVELALPYGDKVTQQQGGFHGGAMGALADIAGGYAAKRIVVTTAELTHLDAEGRTTLFAMMQQTLVPVPQTY